MKRFFLYIILCVTAMMSCTEARKDSETKPDAVDTIPMMVMQIQKCSKLYTAEYNVHKIVTHDDKMRLKGSFMKQDLDITLPFGSRKIAIPMDATLKAYIDFSQFSEKNIRRDGQKIEIVLPDPKVELTSSRINHRDVKKQVALLRSNFTDEEMTGYERQGREDIIKSIPQMGIIEMARENAAHTLVPMIAQTGFREEDITVTFRKKFTVEDLPLIFERRGTENGR